jgi:membrane protease YdiL (CAAX protease family)
MTALGRLKRSCFCAVVAVISSTAAVLLVGLLENQANSLGSGTAGLLLDLLGIPLAPGWFLTRGMFERAGNLSSLSQIVGPALLALLVSGVIDTGLIFVVWELSRKMTRASDSDNTSRIN